MYQDAGILVFSPDNRRLVVGHQPWIGCAWDNFVFDLESGEKVFTISSFRTADYAFSPDGTVLVGADSNTRVVFWEAATGKERAGVTLNEKPFQGSVNLLFNADGSILYASENKAGVFALDPKAPRLTKPFVDEVKANGNYDLALSPDEKTLYVRSTNRVIVFDTESRTATGALNILDRSASHYRYDLGPDGTRMVALVWGDRTQQRVELWDVQA